MPGFYLPNLRTRANHARSLPGVPPTGKHVRIPFTSVVNIRGDKLFHEHISWDQATVLRQLGLLPEYLPFPYPIDGEPSTRGKKMEYRVPTVGAEGSEKLVSEGAAESNQLFGFRVREVDPEAAFSEK
jgi:carboxymethylenebutenolidase